MNLWPDSLDTTELTPLYVLTELSHVPIIQGRLRAHVSHKENQAAVTLKRDGQSVELLNLDNAKGYPCKLWFDGKCSKVRTSAELIGKLAWAFNHDKTKMVIADLLEK